MDMLTVITTVQTVQLFDRIYKQRITETRIYKMLSLVSIYIKV